jgi:hypothetical protein
MSNDFDYSICPDCGFEICQCEDDYEPEFDCHMDRNGFCGKAGSEECDFECPYRDVKKN